MGALATVYTRALNAIGLATVGQVLDAKLAAAKARQGVGSGVEIQSGRFGYESLPEFRGDKLFDTLDAMEGDARVKSALSAQELPILTGKFDVIAASDKPLDKEVAEFIGAVLFRKQSERYGPDFWAAATPYQRILEELDALRVGFSCFVPTWRRVGAKLVYDRWGWIEPDTIDPSLGWKLADDTDDIVEIRRRYRKPSGGWAQQEAISAERLRLFVWDLKGARYPGRSFFRSLYGPWFRKDYLLRQEMARAQKLGSPVPVLNYPSGWGDEEKQRGLEMVKSFRGNASVDAFGMFPKDSNGVQAEVVYVGVDGQVDALRPSIDGENAEIHQGSGTASKNLGETKQGNRALGEDMSADEDNQLRAIATWLTMVEMYGTANIDGWVGPLRRYNFAGAKEDPQIVIPRIGPTEDRTTIKPLVEVWSNPSLPIEIVQTCTERLGYQLPEDVYKRVETERKAKAEADMELQRAKVMQPGGGKDEEKDEAEPAPEVNAIALSAVQERLADLLRPMEGAAGPGHRAPNAIEQRYVNLAEVSDTFRAGEQNALQVLRVMRDDMIHELMGRLRTGKIEPRNLESQRRSAYRGRAKAQARLLEVYQGAGKTGQSHVGEELKRQEAAS